MSIIQRGTVAATMIGVAMLYTGAISAECRTFNSNELRTLVIQKLIKEGMTAQQVERSWGKPTKVRHNSRGNTWEYWNPGGDQIVEFGRDGCVAGWYTARD
ncbi:hypothetical protein [Pseudomonas sp. MYb185]|uniref:hypothetical protein n=1 Tax=Pseudomonas sp. MYb185 TaxID=1848729 RepID=UPI000CFDB008|nr:hypothetical protein [Pseudomonas sp. MYb185]PRB80529.1 hypothetical protein CQ007_12470 [Pseudomonas sp. MYb185]